jgi:hypothetical protein
MRKFWKFGPASLEFSWRDMPGLKYARLGLWALYFKIGLTTSEAEVLAFSKARESLTVPSK